MTRNHIIIGLLLAIVLLAIWGTREKRPGSPAPRSMARRQTSRAKAGPLSIYPDPTLTPGLANPAVTEASVGETICNPYWSTTSIRPPSSYTKRLKRKQMEDLGLGGTSSDYEEDHLISLELGGHPTDARNLWPERYLPTPGAREKDDVENYLHRQVCSGAMTLREAQGEISGDWYRVYLKIHEH